MKKFISLFLFLLVALIASAQINGSGYYRVKNNKTDRYIYVCDGTSSGINTSTTSADMGAIQLWRDNELLSNPASVIYAESIDGKWDFCAQGTSVHQLINYYVEVKGSDANNAYQVSATVSGMTIYLYDSSTSTSANRSFLTTSSGANNDIPAANRVWNVFPMNQDNNYIGVKSDIKIGNDYYAPYYVSFPFSFHSSGMKAFYVSRIDTNAKVAVIKEITGIVPSSTPIFIKCSSEDPSNNKLQLEDYKSHSNRPSDNILNGVYFANKYRVSPVACKEYDSATMRILGKTSEGKIGFITATNEMLENCGTNGKDKWCIKANQVYLPVPEGAPEEFTIMTEEEYNNRDIPVTSITIDKSEATLHIDETVTLNAIITPNDAKNKNVTWSTSNANVATVENGVVTAKALGSAIITAKTTDGTNLSATCTITVNPILAQSISLNKSLIVAKEGDEIQLEATIMPSNTTNKSVAWTIDNNAIASVDNNGLVKIKSAGSAVITATTNDGSNLQATCTVNCTTGITNINADLEGTRYFTPAGQPLTSPKQGLNIVILPNGNVVKVMMKQ